MNAPRKNDGVNISKWVQDNAEWVALGGAIAFGGAAAKSRAGIRMMDKVRTVMPVSAKTHRDIVSNMNRHSGIDRMLLIERGKSVNKHIMEREKRKVNSEFIREFRGSDIYRLAKEMIQEQSDHLTYGQKNRMLLRAAEQLDYDTQVVIDAMKRYSPEGLEGMSLVPGALSYNVDRAKYALRQQGKFTGGHLRKHKKAVKRAEHLLSKGTRNRKPLSRRQHEFIADTFLKEQSLRDDIAEKLKRQEMRSMLRRMGDQQ